MGGGLKRVARLCGGLVAKDSRTGRAIVYDAQGEKVADTSVGGREGAGLTGMPEGSSCGDEL
jgi:hypothetical protein